MAAKLTRLTHKTAIQLYLMAESCTICSSRSRLPARKRHYLIKESWYCRWNNSIWCGDAGIKIAIAVDLTVTLLTVIHRKTEGI
jgi:hypothetical protein